MPAAEVARALEQPRARVGTALAALGEDQWFERKSARVSAQALANLEAGFANAEGGTIVVGLANGVVEGTDADVVRRNELMQAAHDLTEPPVRARARLVPCVNHAGEPDHLLVIDVEQGTVVHANQRDEAFLRIGDENRRLSYSQRVELTHDKGQAVYEAEPLPGVGVHDLDGRWLARYGTAVGRRKVDLVLRARGLVTPEGVMTIAGYLLFAPTPQARFPQAYVRVVRYQGAERASGARQRIVEDVRCEGPIPAVLDDAFDVVEAFQPARWALGRRGMFEEQGLVPDAAWREAIVNAVVHRSYGLGGDHVRVELFDDRIEVESPGRFPGLVEPANLADTPRFARNPRIARVCAELRYGQELGEGLRRMFEEMRLAGLPPPHFHQTAGSVQVRLSGLPLPALTADLPRGWERAMDVLRRVPEMKTGDMVRELRLSRPVVLRLLRGLEAAGIVEWVGMSEKDPHAVWRVIRR